MSASSDSPVTADANGNTGVVHLVEGDRDLEWITEHSSVVPLIPILSISHLTA